MTTKLDVGDLDRLAELLASMAPGEEIVLESGGVPVGRVLPVEKPESTKAKRELNWGFLRGRVEESDPDWWRPMTDAEVDELLGDPTRV